MPAPNTETQHNAAQDANLFPTQTVVGGTAGTADTGGTSAIIRLSGNAATGAQYVEPLGGTIQATLLPLAGLVLSTQTTVGTSATAIPSSPLTSRKSLILYNTGTQTVYLGGSTVTAAAGLPVGTGDYSPSIDLGTTILYGIAGTAGGTINVLEVS